MHAEAVGPKGLYDRARHLCKVVPQPQGLGDLAHPLLRHRRQPPQHIFALLQLLQVLKQALLAQELRRANAIITALSAQTQDCRRFLNKHCTCKTSCTCCSWRGSKDAGQRTCKVANCASSAVSQDWQLPHRSQEKHVNETTQAKEPAVIQPDHRNTIVPSRRTGSFLAHRLQVLALLFVAISRGRQADRLHELAHTRPRSRPEQKPASPELGQQSTEPCSATCACAGNRARPSS